MTNYSFNFTFDYTRLASGFLRQLLAAADARTQQRSPASGSRPAELICTVAVVSVSSGSTRLLTLSNSLMGLC